MLRVVQALENKVTWIIPQALVRELLDTCAGGN